MNHLQEQTGVITKDEFREMMLTNNANNYFEFSNNPNDYEIVPKNDYFENGPCLLQAFELIDEDEEKSISITIYGTYNKETGNIEPTVWYELFDITKDINGEQEWEFDTGVEYTANIDYGKEDWWERLEDDMRKTLTAWRNEHDR